jgi:hypothetical protein
VAASREEKSKASVLVVLATMIPWLVVGSSIHLCTTEALMGELCLPVLSDERLRTCPTGIFCRATNRRGLLRSLIA